MISHSKKYYENHKICYENVKLVGQRSGNCAGEILRKAIRVFRDNKHECQGYIIKNFGRGNII